MLKKEILGACGEQDVKFVSVPRKSAMPRSGRSSTETQELPEPSSTETQEPAKKSKRRNIRRTCCMGLGSVSMEMKDLQQCLLNLKLQGGQTNFRWRSLLTAATNTPDRGQVVGIPLPDQRQLITKPIPDRDQLTELTTIESKPLNGFSVVLDCFHE